jgi:hypothetical protein
MVTSAFGSNTFWGVSALCYVILIKYLSMMTDYSSAAGYDGVIDFD